MKDIKQLKEEKSDNELSLTDDECIAQFMEHHYIVVAPSYKDWQSLMEVIESIEIVVDNVSIETEYVTIEGSGEYGSVAYCKQTTSENEDESKLDVVYRAVVEFIKWYNSQNQ